MVDPASWRDLTVVAHLDEPPFFAPVAGSTPTGCDIELTEMVLGSLGVARIEFVLTSFGELIDGVRAHRWHLNTPMFVTAARAELIRFSRPVWAAVDGFIVRADDERDLASYEAIAADDSVRLAAVSGQVQLATALDIGTPSDRIVEFTDQDAAAQAVLDGVVDASVSTAPGNAAHVARLGDARLRAVPDDRAAERGGQAVGAFSFDHGSQELADAFDRHLGRVLGTDQHVAMMRSYGFDDAALATVLAGPAAR
ncbi:MAG: transporter substrate-binding domain-containing protein [Actinomycetota bacterium]